MSESEFVFKKDVKLEGSSKWISPSNIALVKYWGKYDSQIPKNPSLSFTLTNCYTETKVSYLPKKNKINDFSYDFFFDGKAKQSFNKKLDIFFSKIIKYIPYISNHHFIIESKNSFPHSSGIASSASSLSALTLGLLEIEKKTNNLVNENFFLKKASFLSRIGSGSACRSLDGPIMIWGKTPSFDKSSNLYATNFDKKISPIFLNFQNTILLIDKGEKKISSSDGHKLMKNHSYAKTRYAQARKNISYLKDIIISGDIIEFINIVELEALTLHGLMLSSNPYFILMKPNTLRVIDLILKFRADTKCPICFTLDAGANIHLLYPNEVKIIVKKFIDNELKFFCEDESYIEDKVGKGPKKIVE